MIRIFSLSVSFYHIPIFAHLCDIVKHESLQKRALRYIYNDYVSSYAELLEKGNNPLLYKIINMLGPKYLHEMFVVHDLAYDMRNYMNIVMPKFKTVKYGIKKYISYTGGKLLNVLNNETKQAINIKAFRRFIMLWNGPTCSCFNCIHCSLKCI